MAAERFLYCLAEVLREEIDWSKRQPVGGPYIRNRQVDDDPDDSGGITFMGILSREFDAWNDAKGAPRRRVITMTDDECEEIYFQNYWAPLLCSKLPNGVDLAVVDMGVVCGVGKAAQRLQAALGVKVDGHIGVMTLRAAAEADPVDLLRKFTLQRLDYHAKCKTYWKHGKGWDGRAKRVEAIATEWAGHDPSAFTMSRASNPIPVLPPQVPEVDDVGGWETTTESAPPKAREKEATGAASSKTVLASITAFLTTVGVMFKAIGDMIRQLVALSPKGVGGKVEPLASKAVAVGVMANPFFWGFVVVLGCLVYITRERLAKFLPRFS